MHKFFKLFLIVIAILLAVIVVLYGTYKLMNSRTYQVFGVLITRVDTDEKVVALTFDDAPTAYTNEVLDVLAQKQVTATFYAIGQQIEKYPDLTKKIVANGNELGNHSYSHQRIIFKSQDFINNEIQTTNRLIRQAGYEGKITFRPPNSKKLLGLPWYLDKHDIATVIWDVEPDTYGTTTEFFVSNAIENTRPGSIILLHPLCDTCGEQRQALPLIIDALKQEGYTFVTVSELLQKARPQ
ncbi:MAG: polysaccharide deacetylase family protein [Candidatus Paceibacterota bacterium]